MSSSRWLPLLLACSAPWSSAAALSAPAWSGEDLGSSAAGRALGVANASDACEDDSEAFADTFVRIRPLLAGFRNTFSCSVVYRLYVEPESEYSISVWKMLADLGVPKFECASTGTDICRAAAGPDCTGMNYTLESVCCDSCRRAAGSNEDAIQTWYLGDLEVDEGEALAVHRVVAEMKLGDDLNLFASKNLCQSQIVWCRTSGYEITALPAYGIHGAGGRISQEIKKLSHLYSLTVRGMGLQGALPAQIGACARLAQIDLAGNKLTGTVPSAVADLQSLVSFTIRDNLLSGTLHRSLLLGWKHIRTIDLSHNAFEGHLPDLDFAKHPQLRAIYAASNRFIGMGEVNADVDFLPDFSLDMSSNQLDHLPEALKPLSHMSSLLLAQNRIKTLPAWGYFGNDEVINNWALNTNAQVNDVGTLAWCYWTNFNRPDLKPLEWPALRIADLSGNPLNVSLRHFFAVFGQLPSLTALSCRGCDLFGEFPTTWDVKLRYEHLGGNISGDRDCTLLLAFPSVNHIDVSDNIGVAGCDYIGAATRDPSSPESDQHALRCGRCPVNMRVPDDAVTPLPSVSDCQCQEGMIDGYEKDKGSFCACLENTRFDHALGTCRACSPPLLCEWGGNFSKSLTTPEIRPGYWAPCIAEAEHLAEDGFFSCVSAKICIGGPSVGAQCTDTSLCDGNRTGRSCGRCAAGHYGGADGPCSACSTSPQKARHAMVAVMIGMVPVLMLCPHLFGYRVQTQQSSCGAFMARFTNAKLILRLIVKWTQVLGVVADVNVYWPTQTRSTLDLTKVLGFDLDVVFQVGCLFHQQTAALVLSSKYLMPIVILLLTLLGSLLSIPLDYGLARLSQGRLPSVRVDLDLLTTFIYLLWATFFAALVKSSLSIFDCRKHPGGARTVWLHQELDCFDGSWWWLALGGLVSLMLYGLLFLVVSYLAARRVAKDMKFTGVRGPFAFTAEGLRRRYIHWHVHVAMRDVCLNIALIVLANTGSVQLLCVEVVCVCYAVQVLMHWPYDAASLNIVEIWFAFGVALLIRVSVLFGFHDTVFNVSATELDKVALTEAGVLLATLLGIVLGPAALLAYEIAMSFTPLQSAAPVRLRPFTETEKALFARQVHVLFSQLSQKHFQSMDTKEWDEFLHLFFGGTSKAHLANLSLVRITSSREKSWNMMVSKRSSQEWTLQDRDLAGLFSWWNTAPGDFDGGAEEPEVCQAGSEENTAGGLGEDVQVGDCCSGPVVGIQEETVV